MYTSLYVAKTSCTMIAYRLRGLPVLGMSAVGGESAVGGRASLAIRAKSVVFGVSAAVDCLLLV